MSALLVLYQIEECTVVLTPHSLSVTSKPWPVGPLVTSPQLTLQISDILRPKTKNTWLIHTSTITRNMRYRFDKFQLHNKNILVYICFLFFITCRWFDSRLKLLQTFRNWKQKSGLSLMDMSDTKTDVRWRERGITGSPFTTRATQVGFGH